MFRAEWSPGLRRVSRLLKLDKLSLNCSAFETQLRELKAELESIEQVSKDSTGTVVLDQSSVGRLSRMDAMQQQQMAKETEHRRQQQLVMIDAALRRIEDGSYGECFVCGEDIDPRRLAIAPTSTRCINCVDA